MLWRLSFIFIWYYLYLFFDLNLELFENIRAFFRYIYLRWIEIFTVEFNNESEKDGYFEVQQKDTNFRVLVSPRDTTDTDSAQVALAIDHALTDVDKVRIEASAPFTGKVDVIILRVE